MNRDLLGPDTEAWASRARRGRARICRHVIVVRNQRRTLSCPSVSSEHVFEHLGDPVVAGRGCEVVGGGNRVWMTT